jgi:ribosomal 50S subunit-associated protein YjgA (DUF615 family)
VSQSHEDIARVLGQIEGKVDGINGRLDKLNGTVARHEGRLAKIEAWMWRAIGAGAVILFALERWAR